MIEQFEKALKDIYIPSIIPGVRDVKIVPAGGDGTIYINKNVRTFPYSVIAKPDPNYDFTVKYTDSDERGTIMCTPFKSRYEVHTYVKNQRTAIDLLQHLALQSKRNPYVVFEYGNVSDFRIGLWNPLFSQQTISSEYNDIGGIVDIAWSFYANLVLTSVISTGVIKKVEISFDGSNKTTIEE